MPRWIMEVKLDSGGLCFAPPGLDNTRPSSHRLPLSRKCMMAATATATAKVVRIVRRRPRPAPLGLGTSSWWCGGGWMNGGDAQATHPNPASEPPPSPRRTHARFARFDSHMLLPTRRFWAGPVSREHGLFLGHDGTTCSVRTGATKLPPPAAYAVFYYSIRA